MEWSEILVTLLVASGGLAGLVSAGKFFLERKKPRQDAMRATVETATELIGTLPEIVTTLQSEVARQGAKIEALEGQQDETERKADCLQAEVRSLEEFAGRAVGWMEEAFDRLTMNRITFRPPPKWVKRNE